MIYAIDNSNKINMIEPDKFTEELQEYYKCGRTYDTFREAKASIVAEAEQEFKSALRTVEICRKRLSEKRKLRKKDVKIDNGL